MNLEENLSLYLPKYLSAESERELFSSLKDFPDNIDQRMYTAHLKEEPSLFQGDGIDRLWVMNLPSNEIKQSPCMILSNTCDISAGNERNFPARVVYAPIIRLASYAASIEKSSTKTEEQISNHLDAIRRQYITQIFYLPPQSGILEESIVFLDRVQNIGLSHFDENGLRSTRIFTLSDYGFYLFVFKLSLHFSRIQEKVERRN